MNLRSVGLSWQRVALLLLICVVPTALLWSFRHASFVSDDRWFATGTLVAEGRTWLTSRWPHPFGPANAWRPLVILSYLQTRAWSDGTPLVYSRRLRIDRTDGGGCGRR